MTRPYLTPELADRIAERVHAGEEAAIVAAECELQEWVVALIVQERPAGCPLSPPRRRRSDRDYTAGKTRSLDPADLARLERLAAEGRPAREVAEVLGLREALAAELMLRAKLLQLLDSGCPLPRAAKRLGLPPTRAKRLLREPYFGPKWELRSGERYVTRHTRCPECAASLLVVPCRACHSRKLIAAGEKVWRD